MNSKYAFIPDASTGRLTETDTKRYISRLFFAVTGFEIAGYFVSMALVFALRFFCESFAPQLLESGLFLSVANYLLSFLPLYCVAMPVFCIIASPLPTVTPEKKKMGAKAWWAGLCICFAFMYAGNSISNIVLTFFEGILGITTTNPIESVVAESNILIDVLFLVIAAPILEELFFRKIVCDRIRPLGEGYAIVLSAAIFGLGHGNFYQFAYTFLIGLLLALVYVKTGKLRYSIFYHMAFNLVGGVIAPWVVEFADLEGALALLEQEMPALEEAVVALLRMLPCLAYIMLYMATVAIGVVILIRALVKKKVRLEEGPIRPFGERRVLTVLCTVGTAAAITIYAFTFLYSLMP